MDAGNSPDKEDMVLAFGYETARTIMQSDGRTSPAELAGVSKRFPGARLRERGLIQDGRPTEKFGRAYNLALAKLRGLLSAEEKLELADAFFEVCRADDQVEAREVEAVVQAMAVLGTSKAELFEYMRSRMRR